MSKNVCPLKSLGISLAMAKKAIEAKPAGEQEMYFMPEMSLYYSAPSDKRKNALVFCRATDDWRTSARYHSELSNKDLFIPMSAIEQALINK